jgi:putative ABC transport system permease protein
MTAVIKVLAEARSSLLANKLRTFFMMLGIVIGVAALSTVICIGQGTREQIVGLVAKHGLDLIMVRAGGERQVMAPTADRGIAALSEADVEAIDAEIRNINGASAVQNVRGWQVSHQGKSATVRIFGVSPSWADIRRRPVVRGEFIDQADIVSMAKVVVVGYHTAQVLFGDADPIGQTIHLGNEPFRVKGVFEEVGANAGGEDFDDRVVIPVSTSAKRLFGRPYLEQIVVQVRDVRALPDTAQKVRELLRARHNTKEGTDDFFVRVPEDVKEVALESSNTLDRLLIAVSIVVLLVGGVMIMNIMLISVTQRGHEIGLRRAVGASRSDILRQLLFESLCVTVVAGLIGATLGAATASVLDWQGIVASKVTLTPFLVAILSCSVLALLFGMYPARKAARIDAATALREQRV